ncbi:MULTISPECIES: preprotein translocase subunit SecE [Aequorivita]|uniref:Protein translocase subunit SecE n=2 Tax=Aequorivita TaxID=153265 RepID=A0AB35YYY7_9FLAO|nr:preprotein translocase subunit SecE [Aequorivita sp. Ant34-E75]WGF91317.1 preprotein translocase subunit SecE [Aequorivita sp. Ant34-E75]
MSSSLATRAKYLLKQVAQNLGTRNFNSDVMVNYITESYKELKNHVTWPTWAEAQKLTVIVAVFSVLLALAVWGVDTVFSKVVGIYFDWIKS